MTRKKRRLYMLGLALLGLGTATALALTAFQDNLVFFYSPSDLAAQHVGERASAWAGWSRQAASSALPDGLTIGFRVTDTAQTVPVTYSGIVPGPVPRGAGRGRAGPARGRRRASTPTRCWPSTTRTTCRRRSPTR